MQNNDEAINRMVAEMQNRKAPSEPTGDTSETHDVTMSTGTPKTAEKSVTMSTGSTRSTRYRQTNARFPQVRLSSELLSLVDVVHIIDKSKGRQRRTTSDILTETDPVRTSTSLPRIRRDTASCKGLAVKKGIALRRGLFSFHGKDFSRNAFAYY